MKKLLSVFLLCIVSLVVFQKTTNAQIAMIRVSITVVDIYDTPMSGVSIFVLNSSYGVETGADGKVVLYCFPYSTLRFSYIGYFTQDVDVNNRSVIKVIMQEDLTAYSMNRYNSTPVLNYVIDESFIFS